MKKFIFLFSILLFASSGFALPFGTYLGEFQGVSSYSNGTTANVSSQYNNIGGISSIKWQCVEYARRFLNTKYGVTISTGNAYQQATNTLGSGLTRYVANSSYTFPSGTPLKVGDAIVSDYTGGTAVGHIAIVREIQANKVIVIQQNWTQGTGDAYFECPLTTYSNGTFALQFSASYKIKAIIHANSNNPQPAAQPALLTPIANATNLTGNLNFTWSCPNATEYRVQIIEVNLATTFSTQNGFSGTLAYNANIGNTQSFVWTGAQAGKSYYWSVRANNTSGTSGFAPYRLFSTKAATTGGGGGTFGCNFPTSLSYSNLTKNSATWWWSAVSNATSYTVQYRLSNSSTFTNLGTFSATYTGVTVNGLSPSTCYIWRVVTNCSSGSSSPSNTNTLCTPNTLGINNDGSVVSESSKIDSRAENTEIALANVSIPLLEVSKLNPTPNPSSGTFKVEYEAGEIESEGIISIYDTTGREFYTVTQSLVLGKNTFEVNTELPKGVYMLIMATPKGVSNANLVIE